MQTMQHKIAAALALAALALAPASLAAPFVYPSKWSAAPTAEARAGGIYRSYNPTDFKTLNPFVTAEAANLPHLLAAGSQAAAGLFRLDPSSGAYLPYMAESFTISPNRLVWTINLRAGMKWSDGRAIVPEDFVTTARIQSDPDTASNVHGTFLVNGKPVVLARVDANTLRATFPAVVANAYGILSFDVWPAHVFGPVYAARGMAGVKTMWTLSEKPENVVSAGPFKFAGYRPGERAELVRNEAFGEWNKDAAGRPLPYLEGHTIAIFSGAAQALAQFLAAQTDAFTPASADDLAQVKRVIDSGGLRAVLRANVGALSSTNWVLFNWNRKSDPVKQALFRNPDFRRAMSHLMNRSAMVEIGLGGLGGPSYSSVATSYREWVSPTLKKYDFNPEAARALLAKLGYTKKNAEGVLVRRDGKPLEFNLITIASTPLFLRLAQIFADEAKKVGVKVNVQPTDFNSLVGTITSPGDDRKFDAVLLGFGTGSIDYPLLGDVERCDGGFHLFNLSGKCLAPWETQVSSLFTRGQQELDLARRRQIVNQVQDIESSQQALIFLVAPNQHFTWNARVRGEYPAGIIGAVYGPRDLALTWVQP